MDWELTKENCVPVRQGRSKAALQEIAAQDPAQDALEAKRRYIKWMQEYGVGGGKADLMKVLEACTKELLKYPQYTNDIRFLRIWIQYADCLPDPDDVFLFLKEKSIGRDFALYYEAYATYFELKGNFQGADAVYMDGIQRGVKQLERLKQKHNAFQQRMAQRVQRRIQDEQVMGPPPPEPVRGNLITIGSRAAGRGHSGQQQNSAGIFGVAAAPQQASGLFGLRPGPIQQFRALQLVGLYEDDEFGGGENPRFGLPGYSSMPQVNSRELQSYAVRRKENLDRAQAWNQAPLVPGTAPAPLGPAGSGIDIFTDEEFQDGSDNLPLRTGPAGQPLRCGPSAAAFPLAGQALLLPGADSPGADSLMFSLAPPRTLLRSLPPGPTHSVSDSIAALSISGPAAALPAVAPVQQPQVPPPLSLPRAATGAVANLQSDCATTSRDGHASRPGMLSSKVGVEGPPTSATAAEPADKLKSGESEEVSYEELRAALWSLRNPVPRLETSWTAEAAGPSRLGAAATAIGSGAQLNAADPRRTALSSRPLAPHIVDSATIRSEGGCRDATCAGSVSTSGCGEAAPTGDHVLRAPFGQSLLAPPQQLSGDSCTVDQENGPATAGGVQPRRALADVVPGVRMALGQTAVRTCPSVPAAQHSFRAEPPPPLAAAPSTSAPRSGHPRHDNAPPTVTISTRGAFDLINSMFSEDLPHQQARANSGQARASSSRTEPGMMAAATVLPLSEAARPSWSQPHAVHVASAAAAAVGLPQSEAAGPSRTLPQVPQPVSPPARPLSSAAEPTVTLHTKLAFDALNDMFCDTLPHEEVRKLARRAASSNGTSGGCSHMPISNADVCRLANAHRSSAAAATGTGHRGPLDGIGEGGGGAHSVAAEPSLPTAHGLAGPSSLAVHEDTFFMGTVPTALSGERSRSYVVVGGGRLAPSAGQGPNLAPHRPDMTVGLYEDTEFMARGAGMTGGGGGGAAAVPTGAFILEDTEFMTRHPGSQLAVPPFGGYDRSTRALSGSDVPTVAVPATAELQGPKDLYVPRPGGRATMADVHRYTQSKAALQVYEDTQYGLVE